MAGELVNRFFRFDESFQLELREHWPILVTVFVCLLFGFSPAGYALPFIFPEVIDEFGWSREQATLLASAKYLTGALVAVLVGRALDATSAWFTLLTSLIFAGIGLIAFMFVHNLTTYYWVGLLLGIAGPGAMVSVFVIVSRTFHASQGTAIAIALLGTGLGGAVVPPLITALFGEFGWRIGLASISLGIWVVAVPLLLYSWYRWPKVAMRVTEQEELKPGVRTETPPLWPIVASKPFWIIAFATYAASAVDQAFIQHQVLILKDAELSPALIAVAISAIGVVGMVFRVIVGNVLDKSSNKALSFFYLAIAASALLCFLIANPMYLILFVIFRAAGHAACMLDNTVLAKHSFGPTNIGVLLGVYTAVSNLGSATGPWVMGMLFDAQGSYSTAYIGSAVIALAAAIIVWTLKPQFFLSNFKE